MRFTSTRNKKIDVSGAQAVCVGLSEEGGLFVPTSFPIFTREQIESMTGMEYPLLASQIVGSFWDEMDEKTLQSFTRKAYARFDGEVAPVVKLDEGLFVMELWHGPTHAFKDVALTLLPYLLTESKRIVGKTEKTLVLVATSGDTGKAALEGFKDVDGTEVVVLYPKEGVSQLQKLQMMTQKGKNVKVIALNGNFDDAQTAVKQAFCDEELTAKLKACGCELSSANSINWGRLVPQIAYYFSSYADLVSCGEIEMGERVNYCVPSGNFGDILAGYYAKKMGLPVGKLICASNRNNVLTEFIQTGSYDARRAFFKTTSPSMDILVSSNLERLLFELSDRNDGLTAKRMRELKENGAYSISDEELAVLQADFDAYYADEDEVLDTIAETFDEYGYIVDPHTAVALAAQRAYREESGDEAPCVTLSTASPYKFAFDVLKALEEAPGKTELKTLEKLEYLTAFPLPQSLKELPALPLLHTQEADKKSVKQAIIDYVSQKTSD